MGYAAVAGISGWYGSVPIRMVPRYVTEAGLRHLVRLLNVIVASGVPITSIMSKGRYDPATGVSTPVQAGELFIFTVDFTSGTTKAFQVAYVDGQPRIWFAKEESGAQAFKGKMTMIPTEDAVWDINGRNAYSNAFTAYLDGTTRQDEDNALAIRFDQWLVHHLLGSPYADVPRFHRIDRAALEQACAIAGIDVDADGVPVQSFENDLKILRWFLLYAANAGNREADPNNPTVEVSLQQWVADHVADETSPDYVPGFLGKTKAEILAMTAAQFAVFLVNANHEGQFGADDVYWWLAQFGFTETAGGGFVKPPPPPGSPPSS
jgi:hypothetical protein